MTKYIIYTCLICLIIIAYQIIVMIFRTLDYTFFCDKPVTDGAKGEAFVFHEINKVPVFKYGVPNLVLINENKTKSTEVDVVFILPSGLYVIESKNKKGRFYGSCDEAEWYLSSLNESGDTYNPILQNDTHIKMIQELLCVANIPVHNIIAHSSTCAFKIYDKKERPDVKIIKYENIFKYVVFQEVISLIKKTRISKERITEVGEKLIDIQIENQKYKGIHVENVNHNKATTSNIPNEKSSDSSDKDEYIKSLLKDGMKPEDVAAVTFVDLDTVNKIKLAMGI